MLEDVRAAFPFLEARWKDIRIVHHGLTPAVVRNGRADLMPEPRLVTPAGVSAGALALVGVKFTTARHAAALAIDEVQRSLHVAVTRSRTAEQPLPYAGPGQSTERLPAGLSAAGGALDADVQRHLAGWYGAESADIIGYGGTAGLLRRLSPDLPVLAAEIGYAVRHAMAIRLSDAVLRRTPLASAGHPGRDALEQAAGVMARLLGWDDRQLQAEVAAVEARLGPPPE
jgi:glycerol-3-phosphate dehydrogenase